MDARQVVDRIHGTSGPQREVLLDVSRLIWRLWTGRLPTGIDRVCLEYVARFADRSLAVLQFRGRIFVLAAGDSDRLFALLTDEKAAFRRRLIALGARALWSAKRTPPEPGMLYLNVGHTGLHDSALPRWIERNGVRAVYLVHDLIPITHPQYCRPDEAAKHRERMANALRSAGAIIGNSQATLDEFEDFATSNGLPMPPSIAAWISGPPVPHPVEPKRLERPHFITLGTIEGRKNHILLLNVWRALVRKLGDQAPVLVIIGQRGWKAAEAIAVLETGELGGHVRELGRCGDKELAGWLAGAQALLMPSFAEGFGLPVIEALELGTPVIASDLPVYREIVGGIPTYLDPSDEVGWERAITDFTGDSPERARQMRSISDYSAPTWESHFAKVEDWLGLSTTLLERS